MTAAQLRKSILQMAVQGKLVPQDPNDEPASALLEKIRKERARLIQQGKIKKPKTESRIFRRNGSWWEQTGKEETCIDDEIPFAIPESWEWVRLSALGEIAGGGTPDTKNKNYWVDGTIAWITPADMKRVADKHISRGERNITEAGLKSSSARLIPANSLIYSTRAPIGHIAVSSNPIATNQGFRSLIPYDSRIIDFIYYAIIYFTPQIQKNASGTTFKEISGTKYGQTLLPLPPLAEQKRIAAKLAQFMAIDEKLGDALGSWE